ncbi:MAG: HNH endonuclease [Desulfobacteraceae bacterium]|nr:HNH endonuclease [Desulfobacteraceae bacterium]
MRKAKNCEVCAVEFIPPNSINAGRYCGRACWGLSRRKKVIMRNGYRYVHAHERTINRQGYFPEHYLVFEAGTGVKVERSEVIHHINEIRTDNRINNLMLLSSSDHTRMHALADHKKRREARNSIAS